MHVLATAGHVDHGKSALVRALTGMEPDRFAEERRRGLTLDLGFVWTTIAGQTIAFVDVPGHERFVPTMLAGVGPAPAVVLVVAADEGWMPQTQEHVDALEALQVRHGLLVITRSDLADPERALQQSRDRLRHTGLGHLESVSVSSTTGVGLTALRDALVRLVSSLPPPDSDGPARLWVDRSFSVRGAGTVVTGTLRSGTVRRADELELPDGSLVTVRGLQSLDEPREQVPAVARIALNLRGVPRTAIGRGDALCTPGSFVRTSIVDVRCRAKVDPLPAAALLHVGSAQVAARLRRLGGDVWRLQLQQMLPLHIGDVGLLRDPGRHVVLAGCTILDVDPPALSRRGSAAARAAALDGESGRPEATRELARRGVVSRRRLMQLGVPAPDAQTVQPGGEWLLDPSYAQSLTDRLTALVRSHDAQAPLDRGLRVEVARVALNLPVGDLVRVVARPPLVVRDGKVVDETAADGLPLAVEHALVELVAELGALPLCAPTTGRLADLGLGGREVAAAVRRGRLVQAAAGVLLAPDAVAAAVQCLATLEAPFTVAAARDAWGSSRRVTVPLLELLDRRGTTVRMQDDRRVLART